MNVKNVNIERLIELEESLEKGKELENITEIELYCLNLAKKMPLYDFLEERKNYVEKWYLIDEIKYSLYLMQKYSCTKEELFDRCYTANKIRRYKERKMASILKEQRRMVKRINYYNK